MELIKEKIYNYLFIIIIFFLNLYIAYKFIKNKITIQTSIIFQIIKEGNIPPKNKIIRDNTLNKEMIHLLVINNFKLLSQ